MKKRNRVWIGRLLALCLAMVCLIGCVPEAEMSSDAVRPEQIETVMESGAEHETAAVESGAEHETTAVESGTEETGGEQEITVEEHESYTDKDHVALYLHLYNHLPDNYITKKQAGKLGWNSKEGNLSEVAPGKSIGGTHFGNYEGQLPEKKGRNYFECDINYRDGYRGAERIIYSDDGLVYYTGDHYNTFEQLY